MSADLHSESSIFVCIVEFTAGVRSGIRTHAQMSPMFLVLLNIRQCLGYFWYC